MLVTLYLVLSRYWYRTFIQTYCPTSPFNPLWKMDKAFSPSYFTSPIACVEVEAVEFSRFRFQLQLPHTWSEQVRGRYMWSVRPTRSQPKLKTDHGRPTESQHWTYSPLVTPGLYFQCCKSVTMRLHFLGVIFAIKNVLNNIVYRKKSFPSEESDTKDLTEHISPTK